VPPWHLLQLPKIGGKPHRCICRPWTRVCALSSGLEIIENRFFELESLPDELIGGAKRRLFEVFDRIPKHRLVNFGNHIDRARSLRHPEGLFRTPPFRPASLPLGQPGRPILLQTRNISKFLSKTYHFFPRHRIRATHFPEKHSLGKGGKNGAIVANYRCNR
jgi:hypothetical protein